MKKFKKPDPRRGRPQFSHSSSPSAQPKGRVVVGIHAVKELLKVRPQAVTHLWLREGYVSHPDLNAIAEVAARARIKPTSQSPSVLDKVTSSHQGVIAYANASPEIDWAELKESKQSLLIVLDEVEDPHNLGAVLRTAWLFGAQGVLTPETRAASLTATVSKVAQGAVEHVPVVQESGLQATLKTLKEQGFWLFGLSHKGSASLYQTQIPEKVIWVLGSESSGIRKPIERECDQLISIPQADPEASFNVSVAAALAMGETLRQHGLLTNA